RVQRMGGASRVMRRLAEHRPQLGRAALGDVAVGVPLTGLEGAGNQTSVAGGVLGTGKAADLGENGNRGERADRTNAGNRFQSSPRLAPLARGAAETETERTSLFGGLAPYGIVVTHMLLDLFGDEIASDQALPMRVGAQAATPPAVLSDPAQEPFH